MLIQREHIAGKRVFRYEEATISSYIPNKNTCLVLGAAWGSENTLLSILVVRKNGWQNDSNSHFPFLRECYYSVLVLHDTQEECDNGEFYDQMNAS